MRFALIRKTEGATKHLKEQRRSSPRVGGGRFLLMEGFMESVWQMGAFIIGGSLLFLGLFAQSMLSIDKNLRDRQARVKEVKRF